MMFDLIYFDPVQIKVKVTVANRSSETAEMDNRGVARVKNRSCRKADLNLKL